MSKFIERTKQHIQIDLVNLSEFYVDFYAEVNQAYKKCKSAKDKKKLKTQFKTLEKLVYGNGFSDDKITN